MQHQLVHYYQEEQYSVNPQAFLYDAVSVNVLRLILDGDFIVRILENGSPVVTCAKLVLKVHV